MKKTYNKLTKNTNCDNKKIIFILIAILLAGLIIRLFLIWQPPSVLVTYNGDDMYYYMKIAENIYLGKGISFDGINSIENGFHLLYLISILPIISLTFPDRILASHLALTFLAIANVLTGLFIYLIIKKLTNNKISALLTTGIWMFNPWTIFIMITGVEVALATLFISAALYQYLFAREDIRKGKFALKKIFFTGCLAGLAFLGRSDSIFLTIALFIDISITVLVYTWNKRKWSFKKIIKSASNTVKFLGQNLLMMIKNLSAFFIGLGIFLAPWLIWSKVNFGVYMQSSGTVLIYNSHHGLSFMQTTMNTFFSLTFNGFKLINYFVSVPFLLIILGIIIGSIFFVTRKNKNKSTIISILLFIESIILIIAAFIPESVHIPAGLRSAITLSILGLIGLIIGYILGINTGILRLRFYDIIEILPFAMFLAGIWGFYAILFWHHQSWYYMSLIFATTIIAGYLLDKILSFFNNDYITKNSRKSSKNTKGQSVFKNIAIIIGVLLVVVFAIRFVGLESNGTSPWQADMYRGALIIKEMNISTIAAYNGGIYGYYSGKSIINLDGVTNYDLFLKRKSGMSTIDYLKQSKISYVIDYPCFTKELGESVKPYIYVNYTKDPFCEKTGPIIYEIN